GWLNPAWALGVAPHRLRPWLELLHGPDEKAGDDSVGVEGPLKEDGLLLLRERGGTEVDLMRGRGSDTLVDDLGLLSRVGDDLLLESCQILRAWRALLHLGGQPSPERIDLPLQELARQLAAQLHRFLLAQEGGRVL